MNFNVKGMNIEELLKWEADFEHFSKNHSCPKFRAKYNLLLQDIKKEIDKKKENK